jgi:segregation and condensation protein B
MVMLKAKRSDKVGGKSTEDRLLDLELDHLPQELKWHEWMNRVEAVIFASAKPVEREELSRVVGQDANIDLIIEDIQAELKNRPYDLVATGGGWMHRTRPQYADVIKAAADPRQQRLGFNEIEIGVLCAIAYHQPITRDGLKEIFGKEISRDTLSRLRSMELITNGPKSPSLGAPHTFVTTPTFLATFDLQSLRDLPELEEVTDEYA